MSTFRMGAALALSLGCLLSPGARADQDRIWTLEEVESLSDSAPEEAGLLQNTVEDFTVEAVDDAEGDPAALLDESRIASLAALAAHLSADRSWLTEETLDSLAAQDLYLYELFIRAPERVSLDGGEYRIVVERVGGLWKDFDPTVDPYVVFLNHEIFDGFGDDRALAFQDGAETVLFTWDFERIPALAVTLEEVVEEGLSFLSEAVQTVETEIELGEYRLSVDRDFTSGALAADLQWAGAELFGLPEAATCAPEIAPTSCSSGRPVCGTSGYTPYFVVSALKIKQDHEGLFKGNPEIELFPLRLDATSPVGGTTSPTTTLIFSGRTVTDTAGRSRYLPDINNLNTWYTVNSGLAVYPTNSGNEWSSTLVEQDDEVGKLKMKSTRVNVTKLYNTVNTIVNRSKSMDRFFLLKALYQFLNLIGLFNDGDDLYQESIGVANSLFCTNGLGQPFPKTFTLVSQEWELRGHYACVNPSCTPAPPPNPDPDPFPCFFSTAEGIYHCP